MSGLVDRRKLAVAGAKLRAWWDGAEFDEAAVVAAIEAVVETSEPSAAPVANDSGAIENELFDKEPDPRLQALELLWGEGRIGPGADEAALLTKLELPEGGALAVMGPGLAAPVIALAQAGRALTVLEWRSETRPALNAAIAAAGTPDVHVDAFDLDVTTLALDAFAGLISFDDLTYAGHAPHLALQIARAVKPGGRAILECYVGPPGPDLAHAFASAFAEPQVRARSDIEHALSEAGFDFEGEEDLTDSHIALARARFEALPGLMSGKEAPALCPGAARELAWETETWRVRLRMLARRRLERRRFTLRRRV
jgi:hypothetical protein